MHNRRTDELEFLDKINTWPFAFIVAMGAMAILLMQEAWGTIDGLYFPHAYEAIVFPFVMYTGYQLYLAGIGQQPNTKKMAVMLVAFLSLFLPAFYLVASNQLDVHGMVFSEYSPALAHMPGAPLLPFMCVLALLTPIKTLASGLGDTKG